MFARLKLLVIYTSVVPALALAQSSSVESDETEVVQREELKIPLELVDEKSLIPIERQMLDLLMLTQAEASRLKSSNETFNIIDLISLEQPLLKLIDEYDRLCSIFPGQQACQVNKRLTKLVPQLEAGAGARSDCSKAANKLYHIWLKHPLDWHVTAEAQDWDSSCLASPYAGDASDPSERKTPTFSPDIYSTIGIFLVGKEVRCVGLIRQDGYFLTAAHCQGGAQDKSLALRQPSTNEFRTLHRAEPRNTPSGATDWAIYRIGGGAPLTVAPTELVDMNEDPDLEDSAVFPIGFSFPAAYQLTSENQSGEIADLSPAIRTPIGGMCFHVFEYQGCMHLACQTMGGFSGAPIFRRQAADGPLQVVAILSGGKDRNSACRGKTLPRGTYAVPVKNFRNMLMGES